MKYPSADSLNQATSNEYTFWDIVNMETSLLDKIDWQLHQYTVFDFVNMFLSHGCIFETDKVLMYELSGKPDIKATAANAPNFKRYAEFFTDFCI